MHLLHGSISLDQANLPNLHPYSQIRWGCQEFRVVLACKQIRSLTLRTSRNLRPLPQWTLEWSKAHRSTMTSKTFSDKTYAFWLTFVCDFKKERKSSAKMTVEMLVVNHGILEGQCLNRVFSLFFFFAHNNGLPSSNSQLMCESKSADTKQTHFYWKIGLFSRKQLLSVVVVYFLYHLMQKDSLGKGVKKLRHLLKLSIWFHFHLTFTSCWMSHLFVTGQMSLMAGFGYGFADRVSQKCSLLYVKENTLLFSLTIILMHLDKLQVWREHF